MWQPTALAPEGPARPYEALTASPGERGSRTKLRLKRSAPRPKYVDVFTQANDLAWNRQTPLFDW